MNTYVGLSGAQSDYLGNLYLVGEFNGTVDFAPTSATNNQTSTGSTANAFLMSLDNALAVNFIEVSDSGRFTFKGLHLDNRGNLFTYGLVRQTVANGTMDFDFTAGTDYLTPSVYTDNGFVSKMSQPTFVGVMANEARAVEKLFLTLRRSLSISKMPL